MMRALFAFWMLLLPFSLLAADTTAFTRKEIIYGRKDGMALTLVLLQPEKAKGRAVINIISGNWRSSMRGLPQWIEQSRIYLDAGYSVFLVAHGSAPRYSFQDATADVVRSVRFIRYNAKLYGIDGARIGIVGGSSGGHLALMAALADNAGNPASKDPVEQVSGKVNAAAVFYPPTDFLNWGAPGLSLDAQKPMLEQLGVLGAFTFRRFDTTRFLYTEITDPVAYSALLQSLSPAQLVTADDPPVYLWHGDADPVVPLQQSELLKTRMEAARRPVTLRVKKGGDHGWKDILQDEREFVKWFDEVLR